MRLLECHDDGTFTLSKRFYKERPPYAILSHTWSEDEDHEVTLADLKDGTAEQKPAYEKLVFCAKQTLRLGLKYFWSDTCCFDKSSSAELQEAITAMFRWYSEAEMCLVYLSDNPETNFESCRWFRRGWTLQELLAPKEVYFFSADYWFLGTKRTLAPSIHRATGISVQALHGAPLTSFSMKERLGWAEKRETKREEDRAYSLLGILKISMYINYGEGDIAMLRLMAEIERQATLSNVLPSSFEQQSASDLPRNEPIAAVATPSISTLGMPQTTVGAYDSKIPQSKKEPPVFSIPRASSPSRQQSSTPSNNLPVRHDNLKAMKSSPYVSNFAHPAYSLNRIPSTPRVHSSTSPNSQFPAPNGIGHDSFSSLAHQNIPAQVVSQGIPATRKRPQHRSSSLSSGPPRLGRASSYSPEPSQRRPSPSYSPEPPSRPRASKLNATAAQSAIQDSVIRQQLTPQPPSSIRAYSPVRNISSDPNSSMRRRRSRSQSLPRIQSPREIFPGRSTIGMHQRFSIDSPIALSAPYGAPMSTSRQHNSNNNAVGKDIIILLSLMKDKILGRWDRPIPHLSDENDSEDCEQQRFRR